MKFILTLSILAIALSSQANTCIDQKLDISEASGLSNDSRSLTATPCYKELIKMEDSAKILNPYFEVSKVKGKIAIDGYDKVISSQYCTSLGYANVTEVIDDGRVSREDSFLGFVASFVRLRKIVDVRGGDSIQSIILDDSDGPIIQSITCTK